MTVGERSGEDGGEPPPLLMATSSDNVGGARATAARTKSWTGFPSVTSQVARGWAMRAGLWASRMVAVAARPGHTALGTAAETGEEMRFHETGEDAHVGLEVAGIDEHRGAVHRPHHTWASSL